MKFQKFFNKFWYFLWVCLHWRQLPWMEDEALGPVRGRQCQVCVTTRADKFVGSPTQKRQTSINSAASATPGKWGGFGGRGRAQGNKRHSQQWAAKWSTCWPDSRITSPKQFTPNQKPKTELWKQSSAKFVCFASLNFHKYLLTRIFCVCSLLRNGLNLKNINRKYLYAAAEILQVTFLCQWNRQTKQ